MANSTTEVWPLQSWFSEVSSLIAWNVSISQQCGTLTIVWLTAPAFVLRSVIILGSAPGVSPPHVHSVLWPSTKENLCTRVCSSVWVPQSSSAMLREVWRPLPPLCSPSSPVSSGPLVCKAPRAAHLSGPRVQLVSPFWGSHLCYGIGRCRLPD